MEHRLIRAIGLVAALLVAACGGCNDANKNYRPINDGDDDDDDNETDTHPEFSSDSDADSGADGDADTDTDADSDADTDTDTDTDTDSDADSDADADGDSDADDECGVCPLGSGFPCTCDVADKTCGDGSVCALFAGAQPLDEGICFQPCQSDSDCEPRSGCLAKASCVALPPDDDKFCLYLCLKDTDCPSNMDCLMMDETYGTCYVKGASLPEQPKGDPCDVGKSTFDCEPVSNVGCENGKICNWGIDQNKGITGFICLPEEPNPSTEGEACGDETSAWCGQGLGCTPEEGGDPQAGVCRAYCCGTCEDAAKTCQPLDPMPQFITNPDFGFCR